MCSAEIIQQSSCYLDDFTKIFVVIGTAIIVGLIVGTVVGIIKISSNN